MKLSKISLLIVALLCTVGCRVEPDIIPSTQQEVIYPDPNVGEVKGFFLLNEGNMGSNKATLDYFDYESGIYSKNIFAERNPTVAMELGDVGNDLRIYGDRLYAVINCSNLIEVMDVETAGHIGAVTVPNCRFIVFDGGYAYVSSYAGAVELDPNSRLGYVAKIDTATLQVVAECTVGYQPEQMVVAGDKLYVANSGGYCVPNYDTTVSVIDLNSFTETKKIEVAINLFGMELDTYGNIWVSSRGDFFDIDSKTYVIDSQTDEVTSVLDIPNSGMCRSGDSLYVFSTSWSYTTNSNVASYALLDTESKSVLSESFITDGTQSNLVMPYSVAVNPETQEIFITDAKDYVTPGKLYCYTPEGVLKWSVTTGDIPSQIAFTTKALKPLE